MTSYFRRAGAEILRIIKQAANPAGAVGEVQVYGKDIYNATQPFAVTSDGVVHSLPANEANIWNMPEVAHAADDEFCLATLNAAWTVQGGAWTQGTIDPQAAFGAGNNTRYDLHTQRRRSWIMMQPPADAASHLIYKLYSPPTNAFIWMRGSFASRLDTAPTANDFTLGLVLSGNPPTANDRVIIALNDCKASVIQAEFVKVVAGVPTSVATTIDKFVTQADGQEFQGVGIQKLGTTYHGWAFLSNGNAIYLGNTTYAATIDSISIEVINAVTTSPGNMIVGADFVRVIESAVFLP